MPGKKQAISAKLKSWQLTVAVVSGVAVIVGGVGVFAYQSYTQAQISAVAAAESSIEFGEKRIQETSDLIDELELAIKNSEESLVNTEGQTLDEKEREALLAEIEKSKEIWVEQKTNLLELEAAVKSLKSQLASGGSPREALELLTGNISEISNSDWSPIANQIIALGEKITSVITAQASWQKEVVRLAEEEAAAQAKEAAERMAEEKVIAPVSTITEAGGQTEPSAPAPPDVTEELVVIPVEEGLATIAYIEDFVRTLAPNSFIEWVSGMCAGYYVCGLAWVGGDGSTNQTPARIELDSSPEVLPIYLNQVGISVLVHEAAHARQWSRYGNDIITESAKLTVNVPPSRRWPNGVTGKDAVEYMADCMTIQYLGYSTGSYTRTCTPEQLAEAALTW